MYRSKMKIDYYTEEDTVIDTNITMTHCDRIKSSVRNYFKFKLFFINALES